ncbi:exodeoxyribonuclease V subunit alpha [Desulfotalea psychrophila]|uniref:Related to exodeoxyribonuclease V, alpha chain n=1 Tax=Desulfotalea psychrophila (strain LSv54 / DSM 12343) TaxID=177439 RepID=Q6ANK0_DESPS|nr:exodeoxyribonuclease V subunit alpha [Desulfotalea psychrophila]CAG36074.1 related to exodeoxyribonuclease V, alpha chain [Desulfotalea psychrophila LSv54]
MADNLLEKHFTEFLTGISGLAGEEALRFSGIISGLMQHLAGGSSCVELAKGELALLGKSTLSTQVAGIDETPLTPLVLYGRRLYLQRYFVYEARLARQLLDYASGQSVLRIDPDLLAATFPEELDEGEENHQQKAAEKALQTPFLVVSGGPGTGKTTTVVRILALLHHAIGHKLDVALAAPTGKAAQRLYESILGGADRLPEQLRRDVGEWLPEKAVTLHRLLGTQLNSTRFRHNRENPLGWDLVLLDEASMIDLAMMSKLVDALKPGGRLILLGDKDQLASVESGTVLATVISGLARCSAQLIKTYRFNDEIKAIAIATNAGNGHRAWQLLEKRAVEDWQAYIEGNYRKYISSVQMLSGSGAEDAFASLKKFMVLCGTRRGRRAVEGINQMVEEDLLRQGLRGSNSSWYIGRPILISQNDYNLGLYNGDIGICLPDEDGMLKVWFETGSGTFIRFLPVALSDYDTVFAMTVHKSQGSEFTEVMMVLPIEDNPVLCRELIYTGYYPGQGVCANGCGKTDIYCFACPF